MLKKRGKGEEKEGKGKVCDRKGRKVEIKEWEGNKGDRRRGG